jgi:hypothetical protein
MAGGAEVDIGHMDGAEVERSAGVEEAALRDFGNKVAVKTTSSERPTLTISGDNHGTDPPGPVRSFA